MRYYDQSESTKSGRRFPAFTYYVLYGLLALAVAGFVYASYAAPNAQAFGTNRQALTAKFAAFPFATFSAFRFISFSATFVGQATPFDIFAFEKDGSFRDARNQAFIGGANGFASFERHSFTR